MRTLRMIALAGLAAAAPAAAAAQQVVVPPTGRYQLVVMPGHSASPFLLDSTTGCVWHAIQDQETKRTAFVEVEVQNLHWSMVSQQLLMARIDAVTELNADQKRALRQELERTQCGAFSVLLTQPAPAGQPGPTKAPAPTPPAKAPARR